MKIQLKAYAKINLFLEVTGVLQNGYHSVDMVMQSVNFGDTVTLEDNSSGKITIKGSFCFDMHENTAYHAAKLFLETFGVKNKGVSITIEKKIPFKAGLAGGSADAAAVLIGLNKILNIGASKEDLCFMGAKIGADVPFCILGGTMHATGIGTNLSSLRNIPNCKILLVKPTEEISTKDAYNNLEKNFFDVKSSENLINSISKGNIENIAQNLYNRFDSVNTEKIKKEMLSFGALGCSMSGSGPSVFGIFIDEKDILKCKEHFENNFSSVFLCEPSESSIVVI